MLINKKKQIVANRFELFRVAISNHYGSDSTMIVCYNNLLAESRGFEPPDRLLDQQFSRQPP